MVMLHYFDNPYPLSFEVKQTLKLIFSDDWLADWEEWQNHCDFEALRPEVFALMPLVAYQSTQYQTLKNDRMSRLIGIYKQAWARNQKIYLQARTLADYLNSHQILWGALGAHAASLSAYPAIGTRAIYEIYIWVDDFIDFNQYLINSHWRQIESDKYTTRLRHPDGIYLRIQTRMDLPPQHTTPVIAKLDSTQMILPATIQLWILLTQIRKWRMWSTWLLDVAYWIRSHDIDWEYLDNLAQATNQRPDVYLPLVWLRPYLPADLFDTINTRINKNPISMRQQATYWLKIRGYPLYSIIKNFR